MESNNRVKFVIDELIQYTVEYDMSDLREMVSNQEEMSDIEVIETAIHYDLDVRDRISEDSQNNGDVQGARYSARYRGDTI